MLCFEDKLEALCENYGLLLLLQQNDISAEFVVAFLVEEGYIDLDDYFSFDDEVENPEEDEE